MKFKDFHAGQVIDGGPYRVTEQDVVGFASRWDPQWFHTDPVQAARGPFGGLIASGMHTLAIAMHLLVPVALVGSESYASPGLAYVKWPNPVHVGDALRLHVEVLEVRCSQKRPTLGIVRWRWQLFNQRDEKALETEATSLFDLTNAA